MQQTYVQRSMGRQWRRDGEDILLARHALVHGQDCGLVGPKRFTEKLTRRMVKLHRKRKPLLTQLSDKYAARTHVGMRVGEQHLTRLLWHGTDPGTIPFASFPQRYVVKTNHACKHVLFVDGAPNRRHIQQRLSKWLAEDFYWVNREAQYQRIEPSILVEEFLQEADGSPLLDYRHFCFRGETAVIQVSRTNHPTAEAWFDANWNRLDLCYRHKSHLPRLDVPRPPNLDEMVDVASRLSAPFDFVRVDLYNIAGRVLLGEMSFTPNSGQARFLPDEWDLRLGELWRLRKATTIEADADRAAMARNAPFRARRDRLVTIKHTQAVDELQRITSPDDLIILVDDGQLVEDPAIARGWMPFTERDGAYWGPPADDRAAIAELHKLRSMGASVIAFMWHAFWWLDHYVGLERHLRSKYRCTVDNERLVVFHLEDGR